MDSLPHKILKSQLDFFFSLKIHCNSNKICSKPADISYYRSPKQIAIMSFWYNCLCHQDFIGKDIPAMGTMSEAKVGLCLKGFAV